MNIFSPRVFELRSLQLSPCLLNVYSHSQVEKTCELLGYFVKPDVWLPIVSSAVQKYQHFGSILALANLIKGSAKSAVSDHLSDICMMMSEADICTSRQVGALIVQRVIDIILCRLNADDLVLLYVCKHVNSQ